MARAAGIDLGTTTPRLNLLRRLDEAEPKVSEDKEPS